MQTDAYGTPIRDNEHGIVWYPPSRLNTDLIYD